MDTKRESLIRTRINENLLKVKTESGDVKSLLSLSLQSSKTKTEYNTIEHNPFYADMSVYSYKTNRKDLLRTCIILATSRNTIAQENLIEVISTRLGKIKEKDYKYIANLISLKDPYIVEKVNDFLSYHLNGYHEQHRKYYNQYYGV